MSNAILKPVITEGSMPLDQATPHVHPFIDSRQAMLIDLFDFLNNPAISDEDKRGTVRETREALRQMGILAGVSDDA